MGVVAVGEVLLPRELMIHVLSFLLVTQNAHGEEKEKNENEEKGEEDGKMKSPSSSPSSSSPRFRQDSVARRPQVGGVRDIVLGVGLVCKDWYHNLTGIDSTGRPLCPDLWRQLSITRGLCSPDEVPHDAQDDWRAFFIRECQQVWTWSTRRQIGKLGSGLGEGSFLLSEDKLTATINVNTREESDPGYACLGILTDQKITSRRNHIRIAVKQSYGFFSLGITSGNACQDRDFRINFARFVEWDYKNISYDITGLIIINQNQKGSASGFTDGDVIEARVEDTVVIFYKNGEEVARVVIEAIPPPWHYYWTANCKGSAATILRPDQS